MNGTAWAKDRGRKENDPLKELWLKFHSCGGQFPWHCQCPRKFSAVCPEPALMLWEVPSRHSIREQAHL